MANTDTTTITSNYPRPGSPNTVQDIVLTRKLVSAFYACNSAVLYPMFLGFGLMLAAGIGFPHVQLSVLPAVILTPILAAVLVKPAIDTCAEAAGWRPWRRWFYTIAIPLLTPFCIGCLWTASIQSIILCKLRESGFDPKFTRKSAETMLNLLERNQRLEPLTVREEKA